MNTSLIRILLSLAITAPLHAVDLKVDINDRDNNTVANTEGGFQPMFMAASPANAQSIATTATFGSQTVTITGTGTYDDRKRTLPVNGGASFTQQALLQDFVFAVYNGTNNVAAGLDITIGGLTAGKEYLITVWSFDDESNGTRVSDWSVNGVIAIDDYTFDGRTTAGTNEQYQIGLQGTADAGGNLVISARRDTTSLDAQATPQPSHGVFLNALWVRDLFEDADSDNMPDGWETAHGLDINIDDSILDPDNDMLSNLDEYTAGTDPQDPDSDNDGLLDGYEKKTGAWVTMFNTGTDPLLADTDKDGLLDGVENPDLPWLSAAQPGTNPNIYDTDTDGFSDGEEVTWTPPSDPKDLTKYPQPFAGSTLLVDFENTALRVQPDFQAFVGSGTATGITNLSTPFGPYTVTITATGSTDLKSRDRNTAAGGMGFNPLFRDFIFADTGADDGDGLDVTITGLAPNTTYPVTLWSWDLSSISPARHSTWSASEGDAMVVKVPLYNLNTATLPASHEDRRMQFDAKTDATGKLIIQGRKETGYVPTTPPTVHVILNALAIGAPVSQGPPIFITELGPVTPQGLTLKWTSQDSATYKVEASPDLINWTTLNAAVDGQPDFTSFTDTSAPKGAKERFYRVSRP